jgi:putative transposase
MRVIDMEKSYRYRIYPNKRQRELIQKTFGCVRYVYNYFLDRRIKTYEETKKGMTYYQTCKELTSLKQELEWLKEPDKCSLQNSLKDLDSAYKNFFKNKKGFPKFKSKKDRYKTYRSNTVNNNIKFLGKHIQLPKLGYVKIRDKIIPEGRIINATISQEPNEHYYVSLCCTDVYFEELPKTTQNIGIDLGIISFATLSNAYKIDNPRFYEKSEKKLAKLQKEMSRKTIGGSNWNKARIKVANLNKHIAEQRRDFLQKLTTDIVRKYDTICIEDLKVSKMKETDSNVRNKRVGDVSWYEFRRQLEYKCKWYSKKLVVVDRYYPSSQICHVCGVKDGKKDESVREWVCPYCGTKLDRDVNAAINILNEGLKTA